MTDAEDFKKLIEAIEERDSKFSVKLEDIMLKHEKRLKESNKEWLKLDEILSKTDALLEKQMQKRVEATRKMDEKIQRHKIKGRLLSHSLEDLELNDWK